MYRCDEIPEEPCGRSLDIRAGRVASQYHCWSDLGREEAMAMALRVSHAEGTPEEIAQLRRDAYEVADGPVVLIFDVPASQRWERSHLKSGWTAPPRGLGE